MWHESSRAMDALEGSRVQVQANQIKEALVCRESCAADARRTTYEPQDSSLAVLPKSEQQPNAPGLLLWFLPLLEGKSLSFSRYVLKAGKNTQRFLDQRQALMFRTFGGQFLLLLAEREASPFSLVRFRTWRFTPSGGIQVWTPLTISRGQRPKGRKLTAMQIIINESDQISSEQRDINKGQQDINGALCYVDWHVIRVLQDLVEKLAVQLPQLDLSKVRDNLRVAYYTSKKVADIDPPGCGTNYTLPPKPPAEQPPAEQPSTQNAPAENAEATDKTDLREAA